jgi:acetate kinase
MILTVNSGSSSVKLALFEQDGEKLRVLRDLNRPWSGHAPASLLAQFLAGSSGTPLRVAAHRVVHGGLRLVHSCRIGAEEEAEIERLSRLAPLHNPPALAWLRASRDVLGKSVPQVAVFDTAFFADMPDVAAHYALPRELEREHGVRRYGFHGTAHRAMWRRWCALRPDLRLGGRLITLQLGAGCSATAIREGRAVDTSMGFSPLEGLMMATRAGDMDPGLGLYLQGALGWTPERIDRLFNRESGLLGVSGTTADMRALLESEEPGARLAVELFCYRVRKYLGAYLAVLGGVDGILFGGGIGERAAPVRERILAGMEWCGIALDSKANAAAKGKEARISPADAKVEIYVIPVDEARVLAEEGLAVVDEAQPTLN